jgi:hypothetical protein
MRIYAALVVICLPLVAGCGSAEEPSSNGNQLEFSTGNFDIKSGDNFECFYTSTYSKEELSVIGSSGHQQLGGHHIVVYYTDVPREPQHHPCVDSEMVSWHQIAGSGGDGKETLYLPDGFGLKVPEGKQLVIQSHYINTAGVGRTVRDDVTLELGKPADVRYYVNYLVTDDETFEVAPKSPGKSATECTLDRDFDIILGLPHMHEWGRTYSLDAVGADNSTRTIIEQDTWDASFAGAPPVQYYTEQDPLHFAKGTKLRQTCNWENDTTEPIVFPREMCLAFFYYYPGDGDLDCNMVPQ